MSLVTLKKKTAAKYNNMSVDKPAFSLNGTHRSQGYVGQDTLGRSLPRTPMNGIIPRGHGGCCGKYNITPIVQSGVTSTNNPNIVKSSVVSNFGQLSAQHRWIKRPQPYTVIKPDYTSNLNSQTDYIERLRKDAIETTNTINETVDCSQAVTQNTVCSIIQKSGAVTISSKACHITKDLSETKNIPRTQSMYLLRKANECVINDVVKFATANNRVPLPGN